MITLNALSKVKLAFWMVMGWLVGRVWTSGTAFVLPRFEGEGFMVIP